jgi:hypothetical protein
MNRIVSTAILAVALVAGLPVSGSAQQQTFTVTAGTASVRAEPWVGSMTLADVPRGTVLPVIAIRDQWVAVSVTVEDGSVQSGFVSATLGKLSGGTPSASPARQTAVPFGRPMATAPRQFGLGGHLGGFTLGVGANSRLWTSDRIGVQLGLSRFSIGDGLSFGGGSISSKVSLTQFAPLVLVRLGEPDADDDVVFRPYAGGGLNVFRSTLSVAGSFPGSGFSESSSQTDFGFQAMVGGEIGFRNAPRLTVSGDLGYYSTGTAFGVNIGGLAYGLSVHWYIK